MQLFMRTRSFHWIFVRAESIMNGGGVSRKTRPGIVRIHKACVRLLIHLRERWRRTPRTHLVTSSDMAQTTTQ